MDEEISFRNDSDSMRMVRRSNPAVWTSASDDPHIPNARNLTSPVITNMTGKIPDP